MARDRHLPPRWPCRPPALTGAAPGRARGRCGRRGRSCSPPTCAARSASPPSACCLLRDRQRLRLDAPAASTRWPRALAAPVWSAASPRVHPAHRLRPCRHRRPRRRRAHLGRSRDGGGTRARDDSADRAPPCSCILPWTPCGPFGHECAALRHVRDPVGGMLAGSPDSRRTDCRARRPTRRRTRCRAYSLLESDSVEVLPLCSRVGGTLSPSKTNLRSIPSIRLTGSTPPRARWASVESGVELLDDCVELESEGVGSGRWRRGVRGQRRRLATEQANQNNGQNIAKCFFTAAVSFVARLGHRYQRAGRGQREVGRMRLRHAIAVGAAVATFVMVPRRWHRHNRRAWCAEHAELRRPDHRLGDTQLRPGIHGSATSFTPASIPTMS